MFKNWFLLTLNCVNKILSSKTLFLFAVSILCWFGINAIIDFSTMPALLQRYPQNFFVHRHATSLLLGIMGFVIATRFGKQIYKHSFILLCFAILIALVPLFPNSYELNGTRRWIKIGDALIRVGPIILFLMAPAFCYFCVCIEKKENIRRNTLYLILQFVLINFYFGYIADLPFLFLSDVILGIIILTSKIHLVFKASFLGFLTLLVVLFISIAGHHLLPHVTFLIKLLNIVNINIAHDIKPMVDMQTYLALIDVHSGGILGTGFGGYKDIHNWVYPLPTISSHIYQVIGKEYGAFGFCIVVIIFLFISIFLFNLQIKIADRYYKKIVLAMALFVVLPAFFGIIRTFNLIPMFPSYQIPFIGFGLEWLILYFGSIGMALSASKG
jgi:cell division protein FtsW (lipid II flippase)